ncbi:hypothetical protein KR038_010436, partial [Drosophila bunnanda]
FIFSDDVSLLVTTTQNEYENNVYDEIMNSTREHIDTSQDLNQILRDVQNEHDFLGIYNTDQVNDLTYCLDSISSMADFPYLKQSQESPKYMSVVDESENFDDLINYLNYDNISQLGCDTKTLNTNDRNTPSPTGSCGSSSGSSTSGVQSDISDVSSNRPLDQVIVESVKVGQFIEPHEDGQFNIKLCSNFPNLSEIDNLKPQTSTELKSLRSNNTQNIPFVSSCNLMNNETYISSEITNQSVNQTKNIGTSLKPKTIVLSSRDYRALMQKIHPSGAKPFSKINGTIGSNIPKNIMQKIKIERLKMDPNSDLQKKEQEKTEHSVCQMLKPTNGSLKLDVLKRVAADEKMYKKQQRLIKNRESAYLSRKKKKEYVVALETRINKLEQENKLLKDDNKNLRNQLIAFEKTYKNRAGNTSETVLQSFFFNSKSEKHNIRIAPKPNCSNQKLSNTTVKKNVALLFAMAFMVTLNAGNFQSFFKRSHIQEDSNVLETALKDSSLTGRRLLWGESNAEYNETPISNLHISNQTQVPPLYFLNSPRRTKKENDLKKDTSMLRNFSHNEPPPLAYPSNCIGCCNTSNFNLQSEYFRLAQNLNKLANGNVSTSARFTNGKDNPDGFKLSNEYLDLKTGIHNKHEGKRKIYMDLNEFSSDIQGKRRKIDKKLNKIMFNKSEQINLINAIKRKDDTFYAISFNMDHILLPPSKLSNSARPKMSLLFPKGKQEHNGDFMFVQVDCEVFNTNELNLKSLMIPVGLRPNNTKWKSSTKKDQDVGLNPISDQDTIMINDKPQVRSFYMIGPKTQAAAAASQEKTRLVQ